MGETMEFCQTVPRTWVHRAAVAEVLLTSAVEAGEDVFTIAGQLPRYHAFYGESREPRSEYDPVLLLEASRQACILIAHRFCSVSTGERFVMRDLELTVTDRRGLALRPAPSDFVLRCRILRRFRGRTGLSGLRVACTAKVDGVETTVAQFTFSWVSAEKWASMRAANRSELGLPAVPSLCAQPPRLAAHRVDRREPFNVVISPLKVDGGGAVATEVVVDTAHPVLFDHPLDHLPGMLQLEAFRQLAIAAVGANRITGFAMRFLGFGEFDLANECEAAVEVDDDGPLVRGVLTQGERRIAEARLRFDKQGAPVVVVAAGAMAVPR
ncbi:ScbA/BarX family gamma-butyrolactone biosynthesis protein [Amycolatopsis minnesotensis]|uniref:ScbA/BarX family gamma-butyrolactone biosynthesis protein n=1 Tax=Amycolatopsis minnesotensis TaxID=337894 RepID=A0ABN2QSS7_9PSEU